MADNKGGEFEKFMAEAEARDPLAFARARAERAELEALRKDAERYRWLRAQGGWPESEAAMMGAKPEDFDSMIDDQMSYAREIGTLRAA